MSTGNQTRTRSERVAQLDLPPGRVQRSIRLLQRRDVLLRIGICLAAAVVLWLVTAAWSPPFPYRLGDIPSRSISSRVEFPDEDRIAQERQRARRTVQCVYDNDDHQLRDLREALKDQLLRLTTVDSYEDLDEDGLAFLDRLLGRPTDPPRDRQSGGRDPRQWPQARRQLFQRLRSALADDEELTEFDKALAKAMSDVEDYGLLKAPQHELHEGRMTDICVRRLRDGVRLSPVEIDRVRTREASGRLKVRLVQQDRLRPVAEYLYNWLNSQLPETLSLNQQETQKAADRAVAQVDIGIYTHHAGDLLAAAGQPLDARILDLLQREHQAVVRGMSAGQHVLYSGSSFGMYLALYVLCGSYMVFRKKRWLQNTGKLGKLLLLVVVTVGLCRTAAPWRAEMIPLLLFAMTVVIAYRQELALLLCTVTALLVCLSLGFGIGELVIHAAGMVTAVLLLRRVRSRTKLIYVGLSAGAVTALTAVGVGVLAELPVGMALLSNALWYAFYALVSGLLMTSLLPFAERLFDVQTEISLLELGDVAHPLLQELVRRAPGTYNHSINVASIGEAAADAIGANGLLVRVGAYFHDIGKMLKPGYFVENQGEDANRHEALMPAMSTLIIIAHVKDGADLARKHHLPQSMIDFVLQHHGTTLVEYFYDRASQLREGDPDKEAVDEGSYRYPGPKPQTKETAVLMVADAVESAARTLTDPTPSRIENLVRQIALKRLLDGQFDQCGLTLRELRAIEDSLIKSLAAVYHGRIKYPDRQRA